MIFPDLTDCFVIYLCFPHRGHEVAVDGMTDPQPKQIVPSTLLPGGGEPIVGGDGLYGGISESFEWARIRKRPGIPQPNTRPRNPQTRHGPFAPSKSPIRILSYVVMYIRTAITTARTPSTMPSEGLRNNKARKGPRTTQTAAATKHNIAAMSEYVFAVLAAGG